MRFWLPAAVHAESIALVGDFNDWSTEATKMECDADGDFVVHVELETGRAYRYRFLIDGERWENDWNADYYAANGYGTDDSVRDLTLPADPGAGLTDPDLLGGNGSPPTA